MDVEEDDVSVRFVIVELRLLDFGSFFETTNEVVESQSPARLSRV